MGSKRRKIAATAMALVCSAATLVGSAGVVAAGSSKLPYYRVGNANDAAGAGPTAGTMLMGGGTDVDDAFTWLCSHANGGDILVLRATGTDAYNPYIQGLCPTANSVATLIIGSRTAATSAAGAIIDKAEAIFIAGGDQSNYINYWTGTPVQTAIKGRIAAGRPIGGTSAGMDVLTPFIYSALASQGVTSAQALANPYNRYMTFARDFVAIGTIPGVIGDAHFSARDRMGRDVAFLCRINKDYGVAKPAAIAIDESSALLIESSGNAQVVGSGRVYLLGAPGAPESCAAKSPVTYRNIAVHRIDAKSGGFWLSEAWAAGWGDSYTVSAENGVMSSTQAGGSLY